MGTNSLNFTDEEIANDPVGATRAIINALSGTLVNRDTGGNVIDTSGEASGGDIGALQNFVENLFARNLTTNEGNINTVLLSELGTNGVIAAPTLITDTATITWSDTEMDAVYIVGIGNQSGGGAGSPGGPGGSATRYLSYTAVSGSMPTLPIRGSEGGTSSRSRLTVTDTDGIEKAAINIGLCEGGEAGHTGQPGTGGKNRTYSVSTSPQDPRAFGWRNDAAAVARQAFVSVGYGGRAGADGADGGTANDNSTATGTASILSREYIKPIKNGGTGGNGGDGGNTKLDAPDTDFAPGGSGGSGTDGNDGQSGGSEPDGSQSGGGGGGGGKGGDGYAQRIEATITGLEPGDEIAFAAFGGGAGGVVGTLGSAGTAANLTLDENRGGTGTVGSPGTIGDSAKWIVFKMKASA